MFENITPESIKAEILAEAGTELETREGSFLDSMAGPAALELWKVYRALNGLISIAFPDESSGGYLDLEGAKYGIARKAGTRARAEVSLSGKPGTEAPAGTVFLTADGLAFRLLEGVRLRDGTGTGTVEADTPGDAWNVEAGALTQMITTLPGLESWASGAARGGTDQESDSALYRRISEYRSRPATSGNVYHYQRWCTEVEGVGSARVFPLWNGPGTVRVLLVDSNLEPAAAEIVAAARDHIEEQRPIGATVTVESARGLTVDVAATVTIDGTTTREAVERAFKAGLEAYLKGCVFTQDTLLYNRIAFLLLSIPGVTDYTALTVNGGAANVRVGEDQVPVLGEVRVT